MTDNSAPLPLETVDATGLIGSELLLAKVGKKVKHGKNGKTYSCTITAKGDRLDVHGYIGFSFIGRSTVWTAAD